MALMRQQWRSTERAIEVEMLEPAFQTLLVEEVSAIELPHLISGLECRQTHDTIGGCVISVAVREEAIQVELVGENADV